MRKGVYVASRATGQQKQHWLQLKAQGYPIIASWIHHDVPSSFQRLWQQSLAELAQAEALIAQFSREDLPVRGVYVEIGIALAHNIPVYIYAPEFDFSDVNHPNCREIGSWWAHPNVKIINNVEDAFDDLGYTR